MEDSNRVTNGRTNPSTQSRLKQRLVVSSEDGRRNRIDRFERSRPDRLGVVVDDLHPRLKSDGFDVTDVKARHGSHDFYVEVPSVITVEVGPTRG